MKNWKYELLVAVHELVEMALCVDRGVAEESVNAFDIAYETNRDLGDEDEPGNQPNAPYHREHVFATKLERLLAEELGVHWDDYDKTVMGLSQRAEG
jgi:hypothetical protein